jgi:hypothetical protein
MKEIAKKCAVNLIIILLLKRMRNYFIEKEEIIMTFVLIKKFNIALNMREKNR